MGLEEIVVKGPGEPKKANVSISGVEAGAEALALGVEDEDEAIGASELGIVKPSNPSKRELGESCVDAVATEERALPGTPGTRLGPAAELLLAKRLESEGELDWTRLWLTVAELLEGGGTENVNVACFNTTFSFCKRPNRSRKFSFSAAWVSVLASN